MHARSERSRFAFAAANRIAGGLAWAAAVFQAAPCLAAQPAPGDSAAHELFERKIRPVLADKCFECHSGQARSLKANLLLDSREGMLRGGESGAAIVPGEPQKSLLIQALHSSDPDAAMPPKKAGGKLPSRVIADFEHWISAGAPWPGGGAATSAKQFDLAKRKQEHWCWRPPLAHPAPAVRAGAWVRHPADAFVLSKLEAAGLQPAAKAERAVLLRRLTFDLLGMPPTREETEAFLGDQRPDAVERLVDRLLASPHFGERWARHWMDLVRYGESRGHEFDAPAPNAWQYRDYLIRALNADVPYDQFVTEHLAGDLMPQRLNPKNGAAESILGTGFWFLGEEVHSPVDIRQDELDRVDNQIDVMTKTFLGVTVACARCHDHKFDAISQRDYYALCGYVLSSNRRLARFESLEREAAVSKQLDGWRREARPVLLQAAAEAMRPAVRALQHTLPVANAPAAAPGFGDSERAEAWKKALTASRSAVEDPLFPLAEALLLPGNAAPGAARAAVERALKRIPQAEPGLPNWRVIADFRTTRPAQWAQDGFSFGNAPLPAGEPLVGASAERPLAGILTMNAARRDPAFIGLIAKGASNMGALKNFEGSGQMLRTAEFTLQSGHLLYLLRGSAKVFTPVNSHCLVHGPLHGRTFMAAKGSEQWQWVRHDLSPYAGLRTHVEFAPDGTSELEIALVLESETAAEQPPANPPPIPLPANRLARALTGAELPSATGEAQGLLAKMLSEELQKVLDSMAADRFEKTGDSLLADWMVRHWELFAPDGAETRSTLVAAAKPYLESWQRIREALPKESAVALAIMDGSGTDEFQLKRGSSKMPMQPVPRRMLEALSGPQPMDCGGGSGRLRLAREIASPSNPLTARVMVNRVWHHLFGRGIVASVDNLGVLGQPPSHPELLDTLAVEFVQKHRWSIKGLIRALVLSNTYQMSSRPGDSVAEQKDPENVLLHRMNLKRLEGEAIRDAILTVSGTLKPDMGGPSVPVYLTPFMEGRGRPGAGGPLDGAGRRSVYIAVLRNFLSPMMLAFDTPIPFNTMGRRNVSNVPSQALMLMNDPFVVESAKKWAQQLRPGTTVEERLREMYLSAFSREPRPEETREALAFAREQAELLKSPSTDDLRIWADLAHVLFTAKEFIHLQ